MVRRIFASLVVLVLLGLDACRVAAEEPSRTFAVLVGISDYADKAIQPRRHAEADARALYDLFIDKQFADVPAERVRLLLGSNDGNKDAKRPAKLATRENILQALRWLASEAGANDLVIFAFIGQGGPLGESFCLFGSDAVCKDRGTTALAAADLEKELAPLRSRRFCAFLDVHFRGCDAGAERATLASLADIGKSFLGGETPLAGRLLFLANDGLRPSLDLDGQGLFRRVLLDGLRGAADRDGYEPDGVITVGELTRFFKEKLPEEARASGRTRDEKSQQPHVLGSAGGNFVLTRNPVAWKQALERLDRFGKLPGLSAELREEGRHLLARMPTLLAHQELRKSYQKLADGALTVEGLTAARARVLDQMKLKRSDAVAFAGKVMQAVNKLVAEHLQVVQPGDLVGAACRGMFGRLDVPLPGDLRQRLEQVGTLNEVQMLTMLADVRERLGEREDLDGDRDIDIALQHATGRLDPYTTYYNAAAVRELRNRLSGKFTGIGIRVGKDAARDMLAVVTPIKGSPAHKAGMQTGDIITRIVRKVDGEGKKLSEPEVISTQGMAVGDAVAKIAGKPGTPVTLTVEREGTDRPLEFTIVRQPVETETVLGHRRTDNDEWDYLLDPAARIAYVRLTEFTETTARDLTKVVEGLHKTGGIKGLILDVRSNPGGLLPAAIGVSDLFIDDGLIVSIRNRQGQEQAYTGESAGSWLAFPMAVLINHDSASASEIVAACLQDHHRAIVIGERSFGKGSVQNMGEFKPAGGILKITTASFWRPSGKNLHKPNTKGTEAEDWGVLPDKGFVVPLKRAERYEVESQLIALEIIPRRGREAEAPAIPDRQRARAMEYLRGQINVAAPTAPKKAG